MDRKVTAVIVAAGNSTRMRSVCKDKLSLSIHGTEVLAMTMLAYQKAKSIDEIIVVTRPDAIRTVQNYAETYHISKFKQAVIGGETRMHSVRNGVSSAKDADLVAIADGARPFTTPEGIDKVTETAEKFGGALLCVPAKDTVKLLSPDGAVASTPDRALTMLAQTPQTFIRSVFLPLIEKAIDEKLELTDDASILEHYGKTVMPVIGRYDNIKITTGEDIAFAEAISKMREVDQ